MSRPKTERSSCDPNKTTYSRMEGRRNEKCHHRVSLRHSFQAAGRLPSAKGNERAIGLQEA